MDWNRLHRNLQSIGDTVGRTLAPYADDAPQTVGSRKEAFVVRIQERYGVARASAVRQLDQRLSVTRRWLEKA